MRTALIGCLAVWLCACATTDAPWQVASADASARTVTMECLRRTGSACDITYETIYEGARSACETLGFTDARSFGSVQWGHVQGTYNTTRYSALFACH